MSGSRDPGVTIVNPTEISVMYGSEGVEALNVFFLKFFFQFEIIIIFLVSSFRFI